MNGTATIPCYIGTIKADPVGVGDLAGKPTLHIVAQRRIHNQLAGSRPTGGAIGVPLCRTGPIIQAAAARGGVAPQLARDRAG